jgi:hypothetical protein
MQEINLLCYASRTSYLRMTTARTTCIPPIYAGYSTIIYETNFSSQIRKLGQGT